MIKVSVINSFTPVVNLVKDSFLCKFGKNVAFTILSKNIKQIRSNIAVGLPYICYTRKYVFFVQCTVHVSPDCHDSIFDLQATLLLRGLLQLFMYIVSTRLKSIF